MDTAIMLVGLAANAMFFFASGWLTARARFKSDASDLLTKLSEEQAKNKGIINPEKES